MNSVALKMLFGDRIKFLGLIFGVAFATLLVLQQGGIFVGLLSRAVSLIQDVQEADLWVMDPGVTYIETVRPMRDTELARVRSIQGIDWAAPFFKATGVLRTPAGAAQSATVIGVDDATLIGLPQRVVLGSRDALRAPDAVMVDTDGYAQLFPGEPRTLGRVLELNDRRMVIVAIAEISAPFNTQPQFYTRYAQALALTNNGRNQLSFILAKAAAGADIDRVAAAINRETGLKAVSSQQLSRETIDWIFANTGIPTSFGAVIGLGVLVGIAVVGLTFSMFISDNMKQYAALKAMGVTNGRLTSMVLLQASVIGVIGYGLGLALAAAFFDFAPPASPALRGFYLPDFVAFGMAGMVVVIMLAATLFSLRRVLTIDPAVVFRG